jgi:hypothetical protein
MFNDLVADSGSDALQAIDMLVTQHGRWFKGRGAIDAFPQWFESIKCGIDLFTTTTKNCRCSAGLVKPLSASGCHSGQSPADRTVEMPCWELFGSVQ